MANALLQEVAYLKEGGFSEQQASTLVFFHKNQIDTHLATKTDTLALKKDIAELKKDVAELKKDGAELKKDVAELKKDVVGIKKDIAELKKDVAELKKDVVGIKKDMEILKYSLTVRLGGMVFSGFLLLAGYIGYLGHRNKNHQSQQMQQFLDTQRQIISVLEKIPQTSVPAIVNPPSAVGSKQKN